jgi:hypothetical protein
MIMIIITLSIKERKKNEKRKTKKSVTALPLEEKNDGGERKLEGNK